MQNSTPNQMLMLLTRIGEKSKMVITGDLDQSDKLLDNGLKDFYYKLKDNTKNNLYLIEMEKNDVQRSNLVKEVLNLYNKENLTYEILKKIEKMKLEKNNINKKSIDNVLTNETIIDNVVTDKIITDNVLTNETITDNVVTNKTITDNVVTDKIITDNVVTNKTITNNLVMKNNDDAALIPLNDHLRLKHFNID
jgi:hypothetical protein